jgi:hypothetical protein
MALAVIRERGGSRVELVANGVYGTILTAATMSVLSEKVYDKPLRLSAEVVVTLLVFWLAHAFSLGIAHEAVGGDEEGPGTVREQLAVTWPMVAAAFPLLVPLFLASVGVFSTDVGLWVSYALAIAILASWGLVIGRRRGFGRAHKAWLMAAIGGLGLLLITLKELVH